MKSMATAMRQQARDTARIRELTEQNVSWYWWEHGRADCYASLYGVRPTPPAAPDALALYNRGWWSAQEQLRSTDPRST